MARDNSKLDFVMQDLQTHLQNAHLETQEISSIAKKGDEKVSDILLLLKYVHVKTYLKQVFCVNTEP